MKVNGLKCDICNLAGRPSVRWSSVLVCQSGREL